MYGVFSYCNGLREIVVEMQSIQGKTQISCVLIAQILMVVVRKKVKKCFANMITSIRQYILSFIDWIEYITEKLKAWKRKNAPIVFFKHELSIFNVKKNERNALLYYNPIFLIKFTRTIVIF